MSKNKELKTFESDTDIMDFNGSVVVETNGLQGGDGGHGGCHRVTFNGGIYELEISGPSNKHAPVSVENVTLSVRGDWELEYFIRSLRYAADQLENVKLQTLNNNTEFARIIEGVNAGRVFD